MITHIQMYGERNSGTNFIKKVILGNLEGLEKTIKFGWKHGGLSEPTRFYGPKGNFKVQQVADPNEADDTLFVVVYRNPLSWLQSMHHDPHHAPLHRKLKFGEFIRKPWVTYFTESGQDASRSVARRNARIAPVNVWEDHSSVIELRQAKTKLFEDIKNQVPNVVYVNYELVRDHPERLIDALVKAYGFKRSQAEVAGVTEDKFGTGKYKPRKYKPIPLGDFAYIVDQLDWDSEATMGYKLRSSHWQKTKRAVDGKTSRLRRRPVIAKPSDFITTNYVIRAYKNGRAVKI